MARGGRAWTATRDAIASRRADPLTRSLVRFQRKARSELCYGIIAQLEKETLGHTFHDPRNGRTRTDGEPLEVFGGLDCNGHCGRKDHRRYYDY